MSTTASTTPSGPLRRFMREHIVEILGTDMRGYASTAGFAREQVNKAVGRAA
jgi:hypothetical protein